MPFQPGQSGNPEGGVKQKRFVSALERSIVQDNAVRLRKAVETLQDLAASGEPWAVQMLADRLDGKPKQQTEITGDPESPLVTKLEVVFVNKADDAASKNP